MFACVVDVKGTDEYAVRRMVDFIKESGLTNFVYKNDKENAIIALMEEAVRRSGRAGRRMPRDVPLPDGVDANAGDVSAVPENSAVGESASNWRAEISIQSVEDLLRVHKLAIESRIKAHISSDHAVLR